MVSTAPKAKKSDKALGHLANVVEMFRAAGTNIEERIITLANALFLKNVFHLTGTIHTA